MYEKFSSQPHQPFFTAGILFFIAFLLILSANYSGFIAIDTEIAAMHSYPMIHIIFVQFFLGFLFVVFPRFLTQASVAKKTYMNIFFLFSIGGILYFISLFNASFIYQISIFILLIAQLLSFITLYKIYKKSIVTNKYDVIYILIAFASGVVSNALFFITSLGFFDMQALSINIGFYLFLLGIVYTISQRMIPFFSSIKVPDYKINKSKYILEISFSLLFLKVLALSLQNNYFSFITDIALFLFFTYELIKWKLPITQVSAIMWVLYLSLFWLPLALFISCVESFSNILELGIYFEKSALHTLAVGYFSTILIGFGTRVVLGHSGRTPTADKITVLLFWAIQIVVIVRIFASLSLNANFDYTFWISLSALLLASGLIIWSAKYLKILIKG